jgi:hypothetical protein
MAAAPCERQPRRVVGQLLGIDALAESNCVGAMRGTFIALLLPSCAALVLHGARRAPALVRAQSSRILMTDFARGDDLLANGPKVSDFDIVNVLGRWKSYKDWDTIGVAKELDEILAGTRTYEVVEQAPGEDREYVSKSPRRRDFCIRKGVVQRYIFQENIGLLPFKNQAMAASIGATVREMTAEPINPLAVKIVFDALAQSKSGIENKELVDERRKSFETPSGAFDAEAFERSLGAARGTIIRSLCAFPGVPFVIQAIVLWKIDAFSLAQEASGDLLSTIQSSWERSGPFALLLAAAPVAIVIYGAKNPPKTNKAVQEAAAVDKIFLETRLKTRTKTKTGVPTPTKNY